MNMFRNRRLNEKVSNYAASLTRRVGGYGGVVADNAELRKELADYKSGQNIVELEVENAGLAHKLDVQRKGILHIKEDSSRFQRRSVRAIGDIIKMVNHYVESGRNPLTNEIGGRYAFFDRHGGVVTALSRRAQKMFGYKPGSVNYEDILRLGDIIKLGENADSERLIDRLTVRVAEGDVTIKDVKVVPYMVHDVLVGWVVDFEKIGRVEKIRERLASMRKSASEREDEKVFEEGKRIVREANEERGFG